MTPAVPPNVPVAQDPDEGPQLTPPSTSGPMAVSGQVPSLGTATPDLVASAGAASSPWPSTTSTVTTPSDTTPLPAPPPDPAPSGYAATKSLIQDSLNRSDLTAAHLLLSEWHGNESLTSAERQEVETLLNQLAGTVIYSTEHRLEPAYTVKPGDTLETIAQQYQVPWPLLAKINGIPQADAVQPGQQLKVVRGPFSAVVNPATNELTLQLNGLYAGKFTVDVPPTVQLGEGEFVVENKAQPQGSMMLRSTSAYSSTPTLTLGSAETTAQPTPGTPANLGVAAQDANELCDILSVGSRVVIRR
jgi:LysM repeat protein